MDICIGGNRGCSCLILQLLSLFTAKEEIAVVIIFYICEYRNGFQRLDKIKDSNRQSKQLEELTGKMRECKRYQVSTFQFSYLVAVLLSSTPESYLCWSQINYSPNRENMHVTCGA